MNAVAEKKPPRTLDASQPQKVSYCIPLWLRDEQIRVNTATTPGRIQAVDKREGRVAVVAYGPSLNDTWEAIRDFDYVVSCSGAHKFLIDRGIVPTWHVDVDPRVHKIKLIGEPHKAVEYLLASTCHPDYFRLLLDGGFNVKLWHVFDGSDEAMRVLPPGEWALTGGCAVGLRAMSIARFLGFYQQHVFGMDGSAGISGKHAAEHPNQPKENFPVEYGGVTYLSTPGMLEAARQTMHEMDDLKDVVATFYGEGLVQAMMKTYVRKPQAKPTAIGYNKPELISAEYREQNALLHQQNLAYGVGAGRHVDTVKKLVATIKTADKLPASVLDYGCGKGYLQKALSFPIYEYDPSIPGKEESPRPADLVCCLDVLEHIEPDKLVFVLDDLRRCVQQVGYFVINTAAAAKTLPDGRNTHLIQQGQAWWEAQLGQFFTLGKVFEVGKEIHVLVGPKRGFKPKPAASVFDVSFKLGDARWRTEPYRIGVASDVMMTDRYQALAAAFPDVALCKNMGAKFSLSERNNPEAYFAFVNRTQVWKAFHDYVKAPAFIEKIRSVLRQQSVELPASGLTSRFEFSILPANGGELRPHTDLPSKLVTLVLSMRTIGDDVWQSAWGGGTDVLQPRGAVEVPLDDYKADRALFDCVETFPYAPNQCVIFVKTPHSWHSVGPLAGPAGQWRRTVTINIEKNA